MLIDWNGIDGTDLEPQNNKFNNIIYSVISRLADIDNILKATREELYENKRVMDISDNLRLDDLFSNSKKDLEKIEKFVYDEFKKLIDSLKSTEEVYKNENCRLNLEVMNLKKEKIDIQLKIKEYAQRLINVKKTIGHTSFSINQSFDN